MLDCTCRDLTHVSYLTLIHHISICFFHCLIQQLFCCNFFASHLFHVFVYMKNKLHNWLQSLTKMDFLVSKPRNNQRSNTALMQVSQFDRKQRKHLTACWLKIGKICSLLYEYIQKENLENLILQFLFSSFLMTKISQLWLMSQKKKSIGLCLW